MSLVHPQLAAFAAVIEEASFDGAAQRLCVTPSAISQRVKALEDRLGQVLIVRQPPCRPTEAGQTLLRKVLPMLALEAEAFADFQLDQPAQMAQRRLKIAVNDDSLETWLLPALADLSQQFGYLFDVVVDDQDHSLSLLRDGSVIGAVTSEGKAVQGCDIHPLGIMRYHAIASAQFKARYFAQGLTAESLKAAPMLVFNRKDELQNRFIQAAVGQALQPPTHYIPTSKGFVEAAALNLGWCMVPECMIQDALAEQRIVLLAPDITVDIALYWQHASIRSTTLANLTRVFSKQAQQTLALS
ncbi:putative HTH-type transcriptional regulator/MT2039 [Marinomonas aquimarina]|uniref:Putative HTH-type transcriptional regulator/MT2039 n=1 Tax=Marinomonas aquimarina TaxID=295068 RepID=A0A1A8TNY2_9GAMM|nr:LysR family transcriptional regulator ArgP [Marinomonas aquimarina]SBS34713.1 putative HTH-type transcriptional regulator/MT2039 [Marinomonas aquimarina]